MNNPKRFPIVDVQFHSEHLSTMSEDLSDWERTVLSLWHATAIERLVCGANCGLNSPAAFRNGKLTPIEDDLLLTRDVYGAPYFLYTFKAE